MHEHMYHIYIFAYTSRAHTHTSTHTHTHTHMCVCVCISAIHVLCITHHEHSASIPYFDGSSKHSWLDRAASFSN